MGKEYDAILNKANQLKETYTARSLKATDAGRIREKKLISVDCIRSLILYCDYTELCTDFGKSFRKIHKFELLSQVKSRHSKYCHLSKMLRDTILSYGQWHNGDDTDYGHNGLLPRLVGPLFTGMSVVLNIPQFNIYLSLPTSTTLQTAVAIRFGGKQGMTLTLDNSKGEGQFARGMDCSWVGRFREEDERLFFADKYGDDYGWRPINIESIRVISTAKNYQAIVSAITLFDNIISGNFDDYDQPSPAFVKRSIQILEHLLSTKQSKNMFDPFIYNTWNTFVNCKKEITLSMQGLYVYLASTQRGTDLLSLMFGGKGFRVSQMGVMDDNFDICDDDTNIMKAGIFKNLECLKLQRVQFYDHLCYHSVWFLDYNRKNKYYWPFSWQHLLSWMDNQPKLKEIRISMYIFESEATVNKDVPSLLSNIWSDSSAMKEMLTSKGFEIKWNDFLHSLKIKKKS